MSSQVFGCSPDVVSSPARIYSPTYGATLELEGACYSSPQLVTSITDEDSILTVASGTIYPACGVVQCGRVGLYCYDSVASSGTTIQVFQPLHFPSPFVAPEDDHTDCYQNPIFVKQVYENFAKYRSQDTTFVYGSYAKALTSNLCGTPYRYVACTGSSELVVIDTSGTVHSTILYNGDCYSSPVVTSVAGTDTVVSGTFVTEVTGGCTDVVCTGSSASGASLTYEDPETGQTVLVSFNNLDVGIPNYGVAAEAVDTGVGLNTSGNTTLTFQGSKLRDVIINSVPSSGSLLITVRASGVTKTVFVAGATETAYTIPPASSSIQLDVVAGNRISVGVLSDKPNKPSLKRPVFMAVSWEPVGEKMRNYHTVAVAYAGSTAVNAVGFCGLSNRSEYSFFGTLPATHVTSYPNPDTFLTVQGVGSSEYRLVTCTSDGDATPDESFDEYAGQLLSGTLTFRFYSARALQGAHGEMDAWLDADGDFPDFLKVNDYTAIQRPPGWFRKATAVGDTRRSSVRVVTEGQAQLLRLPGIYKSATGKQLVVGGFPSAFLPATVIGEDGLGYSLSGTAAGLAYTVLDDSETPTEGFWLEENYDLWLAEDGTPIEVE